VGSGSARTTFVVSFVIAFVAMTLWAFANPMFASPDEPYHMVRSSSLVRLESGATVMTRIPATQAWPCFSWVPLTRYTADCQELVFPAVEQPHTNRAGNYPPLAHVIYGAPTLVFDGLPLLHIMRLVGAFVCALAIAVAVTVLTERWTRFVAASVVMVAVVPQVVFLGSSVNPSGLAITFSLALGAAVIVASRSVETVSRLVRWTILVTVIALPMLRRDSAIWAGVLLFVLAVAIGPTVTVRMLRQSFFRFALGAFVISSLAAQLFIRATERFVSGPNVPVEYREGVLMGPDEAWTYLRGTFGEFGWLDTPLPPIAMTFGFVVLGMVILAGLVVSRSWWRWGILAGVAAPFALAALHTHERFPYFQGRYMIPALVIVPVLAGLGIERFSSDRRLVTNLLAVAATAMVGVQVFAFAHNLRRYSVGPDGPLLPGPEAVWQPPGMPVRAYDLLFAALGMATLAVLYWCWSVDRAELEARSDAPVPV